MELSDKIAALEDEINVLKVEVKAVLVDIRDELIKRDGPFAAAPTGRIAAQPATEAGEEAIGEPGLPRIVRLPGVAELDLAPASPPDVAAPPLAAARPAVDAIDLYQKQVQLQQVAAANPRPQAPQVPGAPREWGVLDIASMGKWAEAATRRIGRKRLEDLLGVYELLTGHPQPEARQALLRMLDLCGANHEPTNVSMNDVVTVLSQLDALFRSNSITEVTVLSLLSDAA